MRRLSIPLLAVLLCAGESVAQPAYEDADILTWRLIPTLEIDQPTRAAIAADLSAIEAAHPFLYTIHGVYAWP